MANGNFGFRERDETDLERELGIKFVEKDKDPFPYFINDLVEINCGSVNPIGYYKGLSETGHLILGPYVAIEFHPDLGGKELERDDKKLLS